MSKSASKSRSRPKPGPTRRSRSGAEPRLIELKARIRAMADLLRGDDPAPAPHPPAPNPRAKPAAERQAKAKPRPKPKAKSGPRGTRAARPAAAHKLLELKARVREIADLDAVDSVLSWDQATYMPKGGAAARARQSATLSRLAHEKLTDPALGRLLADLEGPAAGEIGDPADAGLVRVARRDFERAVKVPPEFMARWSEARSASYDAWTRARPADDFAAMRPFLQQALDFSRAYADYLGPYDHIADPLIDRQDEGMTTASVRALFDALRAGLVPIVRAISEQAAADAGCLRGDFPEQAQLDFALAVIERFGYDFDRGRLDKTHHPFCTRFASGDVRITTRVRPDDLTEALFSTLHEAGHALYEQGVDPAFDGTPLGAGTSMGVHESQSRLWENVVGRSRGFWEHFYPKLRDTFPEPFGRVSPDAFYRAINKVERSLIRTDADEVTYNLHVMLRFDLELELLEGRLAVKDLPEAWRARFQADLGLTPADDRDGCLQDVHWYAGNVGGAFQSYTIGNILSAQFYAAAVAAHPGIPDDMTRGAFGTLHAWLRDRVYRHGRSVGAGDVVERATGAPMTIAPYIAYLRSKYGALYELPPQARARRPRKKAAAAEFSRKKA